MARKKKKRSKSVELKASWSDKENAWTVDAWGDAWDQKPPVEQPCSTCGLYKEFCLCSSFKPWGADPVNQPAHYVDGRKIEPIDVIRDWSKGLSGYEAVCLGHVLRYVSRAGRKGDKNTDLKKALFYLNDWITEVDPDTE